MLIPHLCKRAPLRLSYGQKRILSTATPTQFTSFFFHNSQWSRRMTVAALDSPPEATHFKARPVYKIGQVFGQYSQLSKAQLTVLNVLATMSGVALSPLPTTVPVLLATAVGTTLCSASANAYNQLQEVPFDAQMARTRSRPIVRRAMTPLHAFTFATVTGIAGPAILWSMTNATTALLGAGNIVLYAGLYTWMKRRTMWNTWVGAIVGAIPPVMGWTACGGQLLPTLDYPIHTFLPWATGMVDLALVNNPLGPAALFMLLFSWQFPHFNSLAYWVRGSYAQAGYKMLSVLDAKKNALVSLRHAGLLVPICSVLIPISGLTTWAFALTSLPVNLALLSSAWKFYKAGSEKEARKLFRYGLVYLPVILGLMMVHKQGVEWFGWMQEKEPKEESKAISA